MLSERKVSSERAGYLKLAILPIRLYQLTLSPFFGRACRFSPSCSSYAIEAVLRHGIWQGYYLGFRRILRCRPGGGCGYDPPPPSRNSS